MERGRVGRVQVHQSRNAPGQEHRAAGVGLPGREERRRGDGAGELDRHSFRHGHPVEVLFPLIRRDLIVHQEDALDAERPAPPDHHLPMDEPVVHAREDERHQGSRIALPPLAAA